MDLTLDEEYAALRETVADFARTVVAPVVGDLYERGEFPYDLVRRMGTMGLFGLPIAEEHGGMGGDYFALCVALEELARVDSSVAITLEAAVSLGAMPIARFGTAEQKDALAPPARRRGRARRIRPHRARRWLRRRGHRHHRPPRRRRVGDQRGQELHHQLRHRDHRPHHGDRGDRRAGGRKEISAIIVPAGTPGLTVSEKYSKVGWASSDTRGLFFDDVRVPAQNLLGERGRGYAQFLATLDEGRVAIAALAVGLAQGCVDESLRYARERVSFGRRIGEYQAVQFAIADMEARAHTARLAYYAAASRMLRGEPFKKEAAIAKLVASNAAMDNARAATQVFGGYGFMNEYPVARFYRDAKVLEIGEGTSEIQRMVIARELGL